MNLAQPIGIYLSLWANLNPGKPAPFPGTANSYRQLNTNCFQDLVAKMHIYVSLNPDKTAGGSFNVADTRDGMSWEMIWQDICAYFGLEGGGPPEDGQLAGEEWVMSVKEQWGSWETSTGVKEGVVEKTAWGFMTTVA
jgi:hypothetical protein